MISKTNLLEEWQTTQTHLTDSRRVLTCLFKIFINNTMDIRIIELNLLFLIDAPNSYMDFCFLIRL